MIKKKMINIIFIMLIIGIYIDIKKKRITEEELHDSREHLAVM